MYQNNRLQNGPTWQPTNAIQANSNPHYGRNNHNRFSMPQQNQGWQQPN